MYIYCYNWEIVKLEQAKKKITLLWVPSHKDIKGNERADEGAKVTVESPDSPYLTSMSIKNEDKL